MNSWLQIQGNAPAAAALPLLHIVRILRIRNMKLQPGVLLISLFW